MIDGIVDQFSGLFGDKLKENNLENVDAKGGLDVLKDSFTDGLKKEVTGGGIGNVMSLFGGGDTGSNPFVKTIIGSFVGKFASKFGVSEGVASTIGSAVIPQIMDKFTSKAKEEGKDNEDGIKEMITGGLLDSAKDKVGGMLGGLFK